MTKGEFIDLIVDTVLLGDNSDETQTRLHPKVAEKHAELAINTLLVKAYLSGRKMNSFAVLDTFSKRYRNVPVLYSNEFEVYYSELPAPIVNLSDNSGIRMITKGNNKSEAFTYIDNNSDQIWDLLPVNKVICSTDFKLIDNIVEYSNIPEECKKVTMMLIIPFSAYEYDEEINIPAGSYNDIFTLIRQQLQGREQFPYNTLNNNNPNNNGKQ